MTQSREAYWRQRALAAEDLLESESPEPKPVDENPGSHRTPTGAYFDTDDAEALNGLRRLRNSEDEPLSKVMFRLEEEMRDRLIALERLRRAGYSVDEGMQQLISPFIDRLLVDLSSGRTTIDFLSRPPMLRADKLPIGAVFTHQGRLFELKRAPLDDESTLVCYEWNRDDRTMPVDRREQVSPLGRVVFDDRRKTIKLGLLEIAQAANEEAQKNAAAAEFATSTIKQLESLKR